MASSAPYETGDAFWAPDPYHQKDPTLALDGARPWLVVSTAAYPHQGEDYVCCALTSYGQRLPELVPLEQDDWETGGPTRASQIDPLTIFTIKHEWTGRFLGHVAANKVNRARRIIKRFF